MLRCALGLHRWKYSHPSPAIKKTQAGNWPYSVSQYRRCKLCQKQQVEVNCAFNWEPYWIDLSKVMRRLKT